MFHEGPEGLPGSRVPEAREMVVRRGYDFPAIGAEGRGAYRSFMACEGGQRFSCRDIPETRGVIF